MSKRESKLPVSMEVTYRDVRRAYFGLAGLISGNVKEGAKSFNPELPLKVVMKIKRMMGVMTPLIKDIEEAEKEITEVFKWNGDLKNVPDGLDAKLNELYTVTCTVGTDVLTDTDFAHLSSVPVAFVGSLLELGPFFVEDGEDDPAPTVEKGAGKDTDKNE